VVARAKAKKPAPPPSSVNEHDEEEALARARAAEALNAQFADRIAALEAKGEEAAKLSYDPRVEVVVRRDVWDALMLSKSRNDDAATRFAEQMRQREEGTFAAFANNADINEKQRRADIEYGNEQRKRGDALQEKLNEASGTIAKMIRESEEAALQRKRIEADLERAHLSNERTGMELHAQNQRHAIDVNAFAQHMAPTAQVLAQGLMMIIKQYVPVIMSSVAGGAGVAAAGAPANAPQGATGGLPGNGAQGGAPAEVLRPNPNQTADFQVALVGVVSSCSPETMSYARAIMSSHILAQAGVPPPPQDVAENFFGLVVRDAGEAKVKALLDSLKIAYVHVPQQGPAVAAA
jgi:hypothetical protein